MKISRTKKIIICVLCLFSLSLFMCMPILAEGEIMPIMNAEDGKITDSGNNAPLDPDAGTVADGTGDGILGDASDALDDFSQGVSDAASDMMGGMNGQGSNAATGNVSDSSTTAAGDGAMTDDGTGVAAAVIICIIIAIAVIVLIIVLKKRD